MRIMVTGATGFLGSHIVRQLVDRGDTVVALVRNPKKANNNLNAAIAYGDITNLESLRLACRDVDAVIHSAAKVGTWGSYRSFYRANVEGTQNVIDACLAASVKKLVFTSTPSVTFDGGHIRNGNETLPYASRYLNAYQKTKSISEQLVLATNNECGLMTTSLRPHVIWGAGDNHSIPRFLDAARNGKLKIVGDGQNRISMIHVENAAAAHLRALDSKNVGGKAYFVNEPESVNLWDWYARILSELKFKPVTKKISFESAYRLGALLEWTHRAIPFLGEPRLTRFVAAVLAKDHYFCADQATTDFGFRIELSREEGMVALIASLKQGRE